MEKENYILLKIKESGKDNGLIINLKKVKIKNND